MPSLPSDVGYGRVHGTFLEVVADGTDLDDLPDAKAPQGSVTFTPSIKYAVHDGQNITVLLKPITASVDKVTGFFATKLLATNDPQLNPTNFTYAVKFNIIDLAIPGFSISVAEGTDVDITELIPVAINNGTLTLRGPAGDSAYETWLSLGNTGTPQQFLDSLKGADGTGGSGGTDVEVVRDTIAAALGASGLVTVTANDVANTITIGVDGSGAGFVEAVQDAVAGMLVAGTNVGVVYNDTAGTLTISSAGTGGGGITDSETVRDTIGAALGGVGLIQVTSSDINDTITIATTATANATDAQLRDRATHSGLQTSSTISDFNEAVQDAVAALLQQGTGVTLSYNDAGNSLTVTSTGSGGVTDPEVVRDTIGAALVGSGVISVVLNDAADTIVISSTATANSTDAQLRDRATHTGIQEIGTVDTLSEQLLNKAGLSHSHVVADITGFNTGVQTYLDANQYKKIIYYNTGAQPPADAPEQALLLELGGTVGQPIYTSLYGAAQLLSANSYQSSDITPTAGRTWFLHVLTMRTDGTAAVHPSSITGLGKNYTPVSQIIGGASGAQTHASSLYQLTGASAITAGRITVTYATGVSPTAILMRLIEVASVDRGAIVRAATPYTGTSTSAANATFPTAPAAGNSVMVLGLHNSSSAAIAPDADFTAFGGSVSGSPPAFKDAVGYKNGAADTTAGVVTAGTTVKIVHAIELLPV
jgi:hypothetical protein